MILPPDAPPLRAAVALAALLLAACGGGTAGDGPAAGMNVVVVTLDTTRADALGCYGNPAAKTPHLDALARAGTRFASAFSETNVTKPSHVSILSGQRAIQHRVFSNASRNPDELETLPLWFQRAGYRTGAFVSAVQLAQPDWRGLDVHEGPPPGQEQRTAGAVTSAAIDFVRESAGEPFFLWVHYFDPHILYQPPPRVARSFYEGDPRAGDGPLLSELPYVKDWDLPSLSAWLEGIRDPAYPEAMYAAEVYYTDRELGRLLETLESEGLADETVVCVIADHGEAFGEHGIYYDHLGLYEPSVRIPFLLRMPGYPEGVVVAEPVSQIDLVPTLAELFGLPFGRDAAGVSLHGALRGEAPPALAERPRLLFEAAHNRQVGVREGRWKLVWPVVESRRLPAEPALYDLEADPGELVNLFEREPEVVARLQPHLEPWLALGMIQKGDVPEVEADVQRMLEGLGYVGEDDEDEAQD